MVFSATFRNKRPSGNIVWDAKIPEFPGSGSQADYLNLGYPGKAKRLEVTINHFLRASVALLCQTQVSPIRSYPSHPLLHPRNIIIALCVQSLFNICFSEPLLYRHELINCSSALFDRSAPLSLSFSATRLCSLFKEKANSGPCPVLVERELWGQGEA